MRPRLTVLTLGVDDLERAVAFYRDGLGFPTEGIVGKEFAHGAVAFFDLESGVRLALWPRASIAHDTGLPVAPHAPTELTLGHNVRSRTEVDAVMAQVAHAGARMVKPAAETFWGGYAGYFQDPDGHLWEVVWNPQWSEPSPVTSSASRVIRAMPESVYAAFLDPALLVQWLPPGGMTGRIHAFDARVGGGYRMSLYYPATEATARGKTGDREDMVDVRFVELSPPERIVEAVRFVSDDPAFGGEMSLTISLEPVPAGTSVRLAFADLPPGLRAEDNDAGAELSLAQLARLLEH